MSLPSRSRLVIAVLYSGAIVIWLLVILGVLKKESEGVGLAIAAAAAVLAALIIFRQRAKIR
jgi:hypothetical protein